MCDLGCDADLGEVGGVARHEEAHPVVLSRVGGLEQPHSERGTNFNVFKGMGSMAMFKIAKRSTSVNVTSKGRRPPGPYTNDVNGEGGGGSQILTA